MTRLLLLPFPIFAATPAWAEVCDKAAGEDWRPEHGPIPWSIHAIAPEWPAAEGWKIIAAAIVFAVLLASKARGFAWIAAAALLLATGHSMLVWALYRNDEPANIIPIAAHEGCVPSSLLASGSLGPSIGLALAWALVALFALYPLRLRHAA